MMEKLVSGNISGHLSENPMLVNSHQWVYNKGHLAIQLLIRMTKTWRKSIDKKNVMVVIFIDFQTAFDSIPHKYVLLKLQRFGISGKLFEWIKNYLKNRSQYSKTEKVKSDI